MLLVQEVGGMLYQGRLTRSLLALGSTLLCGLRRRFGLESAVRLLRLLELGPALAAEARLGGGVAELFEVGARAEGVAGPSRSR